MDLNAIPIQNPSVLSREIFDGEMVLVNADKAASLALTNQTAVIVWKMVDGRNSVRDIIDGVKNLFKDVPDDVTEDIQNLLDMLAEDGFIGLEYVSPD